MTYPAEPWRLYGQLNASVFLVPVSRVAADVPDGCTLITLAGRAVVGAAWVRYTEPGVLAYGELMATVLVRRGWRVLPSIVAIWVDSPASRDGGRALWGIPKELAGFEFAGTRRAAATADATIATGRVRPWLTLPGRCPVRFAIAQRLAGRTKVSPVRATASITLDSAEFTPAPGGPLGFLHGRRPLMSLSLREFEMHFGG